MISESNAIAAIGWMLGSTIHPMDDDASLTRWARRNAVVIRLSEALPYFAELAEAAIEERRRVARSLEVIARLSRRCDEMELSHVFPKAGAHLPDMGQDIDLLVLGSRQVDEGLRNGADWMALDQGTFNIVSGKRAYLADGVVIEIHHGRVGQIGERKGFAEALVHGAIRNEPGDWPRPPAEAQLVLQAVQRVYAHRTIRATDVLQTVRLVRSGLDWDDVENLADIAAARDGLAWYLAAIDRIHRNATGIPLRATAKVANGALRFDGNHYRIPIARVILPLFARSLLIESSRRNVDSAARIAALPVVAGVALARSRSRRT